MKRGNILLFIALGAFVVVCAVFVAKYAIERGGNVSGNASGDRRTAITGRAANHDPEGNVVIDEAGFAVIKTEGAWTIAVTAGEAWSVSVAGSSDAESAFEYGRNGDTLWLRSTARGIDFGGARNTVLTVVVPGGQLSGIDTSAVADVTLRGLRAGDFSVASSGVLTLTAIDSPVTNLSLRTSGAAEIAEWDGVQNLNLDCSGVGDFNIGVTGGEITGDLSGAVSLDWHGSASTVDVETSGISSLTQE